MLTLLRALWTLIRWVLLTVLLVELCSFAVITVSNLVIYGNLREGSRVYYDPYTLFLNLEGPKKTVPQPESPKSIIWCFGGSTMRGQTDNPAATIPSFLAKKLSADGHDGVLVRNWGEDSFNSLLEANYLQKLSIEQNETPDLIVFYDGANESVYFSQYRTPYAHHGYRRLRALIESYHRSAFGLLKPINAAVQASFTKELVDKFKQVAVPVDKDDPAFIMFANLVEQRYARLAQEAQYRGAQFAVVWQPAMWAEHGDVAPAVKALEQDHFINTERFSTMRSNFQTVYNTLRSRLGKHDFFVDFSNALVDRTEAAYQPDGVHLTDAGREMVATKLAPVALEYMSRSTRYRKRLQATANPAGQQAPLQSPGSDRPDAPAPTAPPAETAPAAQ